MIEKLERLGYRVGESLVERASRDTPRFRTELDAVVFICKHFWFQAFNKQIDNLKTNHQVRVTAVWFLIGSCIAIALSQDMYVLHDNNFRLLSHISHSDQYKDKAPLVCSGLHVWVDHPCTPHTHTHTHTHTNVAYI